MAAKGSVIIVVLSEAESTYVSGAYGPYPSISAAEKAAKKKLSCPDAEEDDYGTWRDGDGNALFQITDLAGK